MVCKTLYADKIGIEEIRLCYDDDVTQEELKPGQKLDNLKVNHLICKTKSSKKARVDNEHDANGKDTTSNIDNTTVTIGNTLENSTNAQKKEDGNAGLKSNDTTTKSDKTIADKNRYAVLVGRTGSGKSLLGCALIGK